MRSRLFRFAHFISAVVCLALVGSLVLAQTQTDGQKSDVEVLRINTELVQSPVMVFDKQGHFVDGLQRDQFDLRIDGRVQPISFFDRVTAGTAAEAAKLEAARKGGTPATAVASAPKGSVYGRTLIFFVDDLHLTQESVNRARAAILKFIDEFMGQNDRALLTTASGQIGFLQQVTDNKDVLRAAAARLKQRQQSILDEERPPMGPYQALGIDQNNGEVLKYYVEMYFADAVQHMNESVKTTGVSAGTPGAGRDASAMAQMQGEQGRRTAEIHVRGRARNILSQYNSVNAASLASLRYLMGSALELPGNKLIFVISDGFYLNRSVVGETQKLKEVTSAAQRAGAVIYSIQASGLSSSYPDAKADLRQGSRMPMNLPRAGNDQDLQAPLYTLAVDTGGRGLFNSNSIDDSIKQGLHETSEYYLIAWRPETADQKTDSFKEIHLTVKDRPDLSVRVHKSYLVSGPGSAAASAKPTKTSPTVSSASSNTPETVPAAASATEINDKIAEALSQFYPVAELPTSVNARFSDTADQGSQIMVGTEISTGRLFSGSPEDRQPHTVDLLGIVLNDNGKTVASFRGQLSADPTTGVANPSIAQTTEIKLKPGIYQVRVAARDQKSGLIGSAVQWVVIPDLTEKRLALSSLFVGDRKGQPVSDPRVPLSINHHFTNDSRLRFFASIYNAARGQDSSGKPDVGMQMRIFRDDQVIFTGPVVKAGTDGIDDLFRIPYAAEISLRTLKAGAYVLQLTASDNVAKSTAVQRVKFLVD